MASIIGTKLTSASGSFTDSTGAVWTLGNSAISGLGIYRNGKLQQYTANVSFCQLLGNGISTYEVIQENSGGEFYGYVTSSNSWTFLSSDPRVVSANDKTISDATGFLIDSNHGVWVLASGPNAGLNLYLDGAAAGYTANVTLGLFHGGVIYQENNAGGWWDWVNSSWASVSGDPRGTGAPAPASAVGYTKQTFGPSVSLNSAQNQSGNIYPFNFFGVNPASVGATQNADGSITIAGGGGDSYGAELCSSQYDSSAPAPYFDGTCFGGGGYFELTASFTGTPTSAGPSFWASDIESMGGGSQGDLTLRQWPGQAAGYGDWVEADVFNFNTGSATQFNIGMHNYYGTPSATSDVNTGSSVSVPAGTDFSQKHKYGFLWVPATASAQGYAKWFFDGSQVGNTVTWNQYSSSGAPPPAQGTTAWSVLDARHLAFILGSASAQNPFTIYSVAVWQKDASNNLTHGVSAPPPTPTPSPTPPAPTPPSPTPPSPTPTPSGGSGNPGPTLSPTAATIVADFAATYTGGQTVDRKLFGMAAGASDDNNFGAFGDNQFLTAAAAINPALWRSWGNQSSSTDPSTYNTIIANLYKANPSGDTQLIANALGASQSAIQSLASALIGKTMPNGAHFPIIGFEIANEGSTASTSAVIAARNGLQAAGNSPILGRPLYMCAPVDACPVGCSNNWSSYMPALGNNVDVIDWHAYVDCANEDLGTGYWSGSYATRFANDISQVDGNLSSYQKTLPLFMGEYNIQCYYLNNTPSMQTYVGAVWAALFLINGLNSSNVTSTNRRLWATVWDSFQDTMYGAIGGSVHNNGGYTIDPHGQFLGAAGATIYGPRYVVHDNTGKGLLTVAVIPPNPNSLNPPPMSLLVINTSGADISNPTIGFSNAPAGASGTVYQWSLDSTASNSFNANGGSNSNSPTGYTIVPPIRKSTSKALTMSNGIIGSGATLKNGSINIFYTQTLLSGLNKSWIAA